jgi:hypothetical protein
MAHQYAEQRRLPSRLVVQPLGKFCRYVQPTPIRHELLDLDERET